MLLWCSAVKLDRLPDSYARDNYLIYITTHDLQKSLKFNDRPLSFKYISIVAGYIDSSRVKHGLFCLRRNCSFPNKFVESVMVAVKLPIVFHLQFVTCHYNICRTYGFMRLLSNFGLR